MSELIANLTMFIPFLLLLYFVNLSERNRTPENPQAGRVLGLFIYIIVILGYISAIGIGLILQIISFVIQLPDMAPPFPAEELDLLSKVGGVGLGLWIPSLVALFFFIPAIRRLLARWIPIDPQNRIHTISLALSMLVLVQLGTTLGLGMEQFNEMIEQTSASSVFISIWSQDILLLLIGLTGVGWLTRRSFLQSLDRLGLKMITWKEGLFGVGIGLVMMIFSICVEMMAIHFNWIDPNIIEITEKSLGPLFESIPGILTLGLAAALGEETIFRGALQPRFGVLFTSVLFALVHANYGLSVATAVVFALALVLAWARNRYNTTVCMIIHATYNIGLGVISLLLE